MMRAFKRLSIVAAACLVMAVPAFAQTAGDPPAFVAKLLTQLEQNGWSPQASKALANAAARLDWSGTKAADPQAVALGLAYGAKQNASLSPTAQAEIALKLALGSVQMQQAGMGQQAVAVAALSAVRDSLPDLQTAIANHSPGSGVGNIVGKAVSTAVRNQIQASVGPQINSHASVGRGMSARGEGAAAGAGGSAPASTPGAPSGTPGAQAR